MPELRCPTCGESFDAAESRAMPFCSVRCQKIDLGRWLGEAQGIPLDPEDLSDHRQQQPDMNSAE